MSKHIFPAIPTFGCQMLDVKETCGAEKGKLSGNVMLSVNLNP